MRAKGRTGVLVEKAIVPMETLLQKQTSQNIHEALQPSRTFSPVSLVVVALLHLCDLNYTNPLIELILYIQQLFMHQWVHTDVWFSQL